MFRQQLIKMHNGKPLPIHNFVGGDENMEFGIMELELENTAITEMPIEINIMLDKSGSMEESCEDGNSKMDQIKHVVINMLRYISNKGNISVNVKTFNSSVENIIEHVVITDANLQEMIDRIKKIYPEDGTNIKRALVAMNNDLEGREKNNIFMSDGDANEGETRPEELAKFIDTKAANYVVGFGLEHNPKIFSALSSRENSSYYFVDKIEKSGMAYGEILHEILHRCLSGVKIMIKNGLIYDWRTNEWRAEIFVGKMSGEMKKTFHIISSKKEEIEITLQGHTEIHGGIIYKYSWNSEENHDLTNMFYRQRTQEILYKVKKINEKTNVKNSEIKEMKTEMKVFMAEMVEYMKTNGINDDRMMKNLCDDIVIVYRTLGTEHGFMYSCSRQESNGTERMHTASDTPKIPKTPMKARFSRQMGGSPDEDVFNFARDIEEPKELDELDELDKLIFDHEISQPCYTAEMATVIKSLSDGAEIEE